MYEGNLGEIKFDSSRRGFELAGVNCSLITHRCMEIRLRNLGVCGHSPFECEQPLSVTIQIKPLLKKFHIALC